LNKLANLFEEQQTARMIQLKTYREMSMLFAATNMAATMTPTSDASTMIMPHKGSKCHFLYKEHKGKTIQ
jgi:hypothetical protein